jgi:hypothetical protein
MTTLLRASCVAWIQNSNDGSWPIADLKNLYFCAGLTPRRGQSGRSAAPGLTRCFFPRGYIYTHPNLPNGDNNS